MTKPWDERWYVEYESGDAISVKAEGSLYEVHYSGGGQYDRAHLIAAAPAMARLLCRLEWIGLATCRPVLDWDRKERALVGWVPDDDGNDGCPCCGAIDSPDDLGKRWHAADCQLDAALTAAGIDAAERKRVRGP